MSQWANDWRDNDHFNVISLTEVTVITGNLIPNFSAEYLAKDFSVELSLC